MAFFQNDKLDPWEEKNLPNNCFFCGENIINGKHNTGGGVYWSGELRHSSIVLHQVCAESLALHLIQDAQALKSVTEQEVKLRPSEKRKTNLRKKYFERD